MSTELEGPRLFRAATIVVTDHDADDLTELATAATNPWSIVPAMLEWLRGRTDYISIIVSENGTLAECAKRIAQWKSGPDLPTALARLVLRVAELEGKS